MMIVKAKKVVTNDVVGRLSTANIVRARKLGGMASFYFDVLPNSGFDGKVEVKQFGIACSLIIGVQKVPYIYQADTDTYYYDWSNVKFNTQKKLMSLFPNDITIVQTKFTRISKVGLDLYCGMSTSTKNADGGELTFDMNEPTAIVYYKAANGPVVVGADMLSDVVGNTFEAIAKRVGQLTLPVSIGGKHGINYGSSQWGPFNYDYYPRDGRVLFSVDGKDLTKSLKHLHYKGNIKNAATYDKFVRVFMS